MIFRVYFLLHGMEHIIAIFISGFGVGNCKRRLECYINFYNLVWTAVYEPLFLIATQIFDVHLT